MIDLDDRFGAAVNELRHELTIASVASASHVVTRDRHRRLATRLAAVAATFILVAGAAAIVSRHGQSTDTPTGPAPLPTAELPLMFPSGQTPKGLVVPAPPERYTAMVASPSGQPFTITVAEGAPPEVAATASTVKVLDRPFVALERHGYALAAACATIITSSTVDFVPVDGAYPDYVELLRSEQVSGADATVSLPFGWAVTMPPSLQGTAYQYSVKLPATRRSGSMWVVPGATAAAIWASYGAPDTIRTADFDGLPAWFSQTASASAVHPGQTTISSHLTWEAGGNAYDIVVPEATEGELVAFARTLRPAAISDLKDSNGGASAVTVASIASSDSSGCAPRTLTVEPLSGPKSSTTRDTTTVSS